VDRGRCTHARATFVSELYYDASNCYGGNTGDSNVTMGRIGWADALARNVTRDFSLFYDKLFNPILNDLFKTTWLYERYTCEGVPAHNNYYIEYPEVIVMFTREIVYGINLHLNYVSISPFVENANDFHYVIGNIDVLYSQQDIVLKLPGKGEQKQVIIGGLKSGTSYNIKSGSFSGKGVVDDKGVLAISSVPVGGNANDVHITRA